MFKSMESKYDFTVIIPQKNSLDTLPRTLESIPVSDRIEIIIADNSETPITKEDIGVNRDYQLVWAAPARYAGGARNEALKVAHGKWLLFADADDYFTDDAFDEFYKHIDTDADIVFFLIDCYDPKKDIHTDRLKMHTDVLRQYLYGDHDEWPLRTRYPSPCAKMIRKQLVDEHNILFDEVLVNNDNYFSGVSSFYAKKINAVDKEVYVYITNTSSVSYISSYNVIKQRVDVIIKLNKFLKKQGKGKYQSGILSLMKSQRYGNRVRLILHAMCKGQNPFVGAGRWFLSKINNGNREVTVTEK